jgi:hypothetical protein
MPFFNALKKSRRAAQAAIFNALKIVMPAGPAHHVSALSRRPGRGEPPGHKRRSIDHEGPGSPALRRFRGSRISRGGRMPATK